MNLVIGNKTSKSVLGMLRRFSVELEIVEGFITPDDRLELYRAYNSMMLILERHCGE